MNKNDNKRQFGNKNFGRKPKEEYEAKKAEQIARQTKNLDAIDATCDFLDTWLRSEGSNRITMKDILNYLNNDKGFTTDDTKAISQYTYLLMELANARANRYISGDRTNIRIIYIEERFKTSFKKELHERATDIVKKYTTLFKWDDKANAEDYKVLGEQETNKE